MHATLSHDTPAASACALLYAFHLWFEVSSRFNHKDDSCHHAFASDTDSLGIGNEKGAMITHHAYFTLGNS